MSYPDIAVPTDSYLDQKESVIIGEGAQWTGRLLATSELPPAEASNYILRQMRAKGWTLLSSLHADKSTYFFVNRVKVLLIDVESKGLLSSGTSLTYVSSFISDQNRVNLPLSR